MNLEDLNNKEPNEIRIMIENGKFNHFDQNEWSDLCNLLMDKYDEKKQYRIWRAIQKETHIHTSAIRNDLHKLIPYTFTLEFDFKGEDLSYFASRASTTRNPLLKAKFADIVWQESKEKNTEFAIKAAEGYLEIADFFLGKENYNYLTKILVHSLDLSVASNNEEILENCINKLKEIIVKLVGLNKFRYTYDLLKGLIDNYERYKDLIDKEKILIAIRKGKEHYEKVDYVWQNRFIELERKILEH